MAGDAGDKHNLKVLPDGSIEGVEAGTGAGAGDASGAGVAQEQLASVGKSVGDVMEHLKVADEKVAEGT